MCLDAFRFSSDGYFYTYSALAQSLAALLGVLGIFGVYRLQIQQNRISEIYKEIRAFFALLETSSIEFTYQWTDEQLRNRLRTLGEGKENLQPGADEIATRLDRAIQRRERIKTPFLPISGLFAIGTVLALFLIGRSEYFAANFAANSEIGAWVTLGVFVLTFAMLTFMVGVAYFCLKDKGQI